ncbi:unnamed protein product, partial [Closterium sp. NIES-53]
MYHPSHTILSTPHPTQVAINAALGFDSFLVMHKAPALLAVSCTRHQHYLPYHAQGTSITCRIMHKAPASHHHIMLLPTVHTPTQVAINTALGFDSFLVMRHGEPPLPLHATSAPAASESARAAPESAPAAPESAPSKRLGCYFCNDVVAPLNSTAHRTLDQQCTVTRPGLAAIAGALAVELLVGLLHHPLGIAAPAEDTTADGFPSSSTSSTSSSSSAHLCSPLGPLPHQLRGFLSSFSQLPITGFAFHQCSACSPT